MVTGRFSKSSKTQLLTLPYIKSPWQIGSTLASHARGPGFKSRSRHMSFWWKIYLQVCYDFPVTTNIVRNHATFHLTYLEVTLKQNSNTRYILESGIYFHQLNTCTFLIQIGLYRRIWDPFFPTEPRVDLLGKLSFMGLNDRIYVFACWLSYNQKRPHASNFYCSPKNDSSLKTFVGKHIWSIKYCSFWWSFKLQNH